MDHLTSSNEVSMDYTLLEAQVQQFPHRIFIKKRKDSTRTEAVPAFKQFKPAKEFRIKNYNCISKQKFF